MCTVWYVIHANFYLKEYKDTSVWVCKAYSLYLGAKVEPENLHKGHLNREKCRYYPLNITSVGLQYIYLFLCLQLNTFMAPVLLIPEVCVTLQM